jgi:hypothetical protein
MVNKRTRTWAPLTRMLSVERFFGDAATIARAGRGPFMTKAQTALALLRNYCPSERPDGFRLIDLLKKFDKQSGGALGGRLGASDNANRKKDDWLILFVAGMWFQDLWTYDFQRTEMCLIPYATEIGEIAFCAYNTGIGWRQVAEATRRNPSVAEWHRLHGRHPVYANPARKVPLPDAAEPAALRVPGDGPLRPRAGTDARPVSAQPPLAARTWRATAK